MKQIRRLKYLWVIIGVVVLAGMMWQLAWADAPVNTHPAQRQIRNMLPSFRDGGAEHAMGAYIPGVGAVITLDMLRGPNTAKNKASYEGVRDWLIYLVKTFGPKLDAVPPTETIAFSVDFYDYGRYTTRQLAITTIAGDAAKTENYKIYLDRVLYAQAVAGSSQPKAAATTAEPKAATTVAPAASPAVTGTVAPGKTTAVSAPAATASGVKATPGPVKTTFSFGDSQTVKMMNPVNGVWESSADGITQTELNKFDLVDFYNMVLSGDLSLETDFKYLEGDMGAGLVFNGSINNNKSGAQMVSLTGKGSFLQWGYYDTKGIFQYQGGLAIQSVANSKNHQLAVKITGSTYSVLLDGKAVGNKIPLINPAKGYCGLLVSTSKILYTSLKVEGTVA